MHLMFFLIIAFGCGAEAASRCDSNPCQNGGVCKKSGPLICRCPDYIYGEFCEEINEDTSASSTQSHSTEPEDKTAYRTTPGKRTTSNGSDGNTASVVSSTTVSGQISTVTGQSTNITSLGISTDDFTGSDSDYRSSSTTEISGHYKNFCLLNPCQNGGTCKSGEKICNCRDFFYGTFCERSSCIPNPCENGKKCTVLNRQGDFECSCSDGYSGENCDIKMNTGTPSGSTQSRSIESRTSEETSSKTRGTDSSTVSPTENMTETPTCTSQETSVISTDGTPATDPNTSSTSDSTIEITNQTSPSDSSSTVSTTENITNTKSEKLPTSTSHVSVTINESSTIDDTDTTNFFSTRNSNKSSSESELSSTLASTQKDNILITDSLNTTLTPATEAASLTTTIMVESSSSTTSYFPNTKGNVITKDTEKTTTVTQENKTNSTTTIKTTKLFTNPNIFSISASLSSDKNEITTPPSEITAKTSEQPVTGITDYTDTKDEFKTTEKISDDPGSKFYTVSSTEEVKVISEKITNAEITTEILNTTIDENIKDDSAKEHISNSARLSYSGGLAIGGGLLAVICLVSSGWYIARKYRRSKFRNTRDYDTNSVISENSNASQNHLV